MYHVSLFQWNKKCLRLEVNVFGSEGTQCLERERDNEGEKAGGREADVDHKVYFLVAKQRIRQRPHKMVSRDFFLLVKIV